MATRGGKRLSPTDILATVILISVLIVFAFRLSTQQIEPSSSLLGLLFSSALYVLFFSVIAGAFFLFLMGMFRPDLNLSKNRNRSVRNRLFSYTNTSSSELAATHQPEKMPDKWSKELIDLVEWRVFEKICMSLWRIKGFNIEETHIGYDGAVNFYLQGNKNKTRIGAVQCKSSKRLKISLSVIREMQAVVAAENLNLGLLMYSGQLSKQAQDFLAKPTVSIKVQNSNNIFKEIQKLEKHHQESLLKEVITDDYAIPSCPKCEKKLVKKESKKGGKLFWGCANFPRCRCAMHMTSNT